MAIHPSVGPVSRLFASVRLAGAGAAYRTCDLVFLDGQPHAVIEWDELPEGDLPAVVVPLDPQSLHPLNWPDAQWMYETEIADPRRLD